MALGGRGVKDGLATPVYSISEEEKELRDVKTGLATPVWIINPDGGGGSGDSAYDIAVANGFVGTEAEWLESLQGEDGIPGTDGTDGADGLSAYQIAVNNGFVGSEADWLLSLQGTDGVDGQDYLKYATNIGDGIATSFVVTHNLGTEDVTVVTKHIASKDVVIPDIDLTSINTVTVIFTDPPAVDEYRVIVIG